MRIPVALAMLLSVAGCQSTVRTETHFLPPTDPAQLACVDRCYQTDRECISSPVPTPAATATPAPPLDAEAQDALREYDECSKRVQAEYEQCQAGARTSSGQRNACYRPVCVVTGKVGAAAEVTAAAAANGNNAESCTRAFNSCFVRCGGRIESRRCEGNC